VGPLPQQRVSGIKRDLLLLKWMVGVVLAVQVATLIELFLD
jgi:hypothetical protein